MISATRIFEFSYAHQLDGHQGPCKDLHGHNAILEVEVVPYMTSAAFKHSFKKQLIAEHGIPLREAMVVDFGDLKKLVQETVLNYVDHKCLNQIFNFHPTAENLCLWIAHTLSDALVGARLLRVRLWETRNCYAEWRMDA